MPGFARPIERAAISVPSGIAEGGGRGSNRDSRRFVVNSLGSVNELEYDLLLARDLRFMPVGLYERRAEQVKEVRRMLSSFAQTLGSSTWRWPAWAELELETGN
jgi:four helix bundle protein